MLAVGKPVDNAGRLTATVDPEFDLGKTIFKTLPPGIKTFFARTKLDTKLQWEAGAEVAIRELYERAGPPPSISDDAPLHNFMLKECDFSVEHADGSFLDHLHFCREYSARYYEDVSPRVMLLHSIMGVGTNCFPMELKKMPMLEKLITKHEFVHVAAFPSVLRLLVHGPLLQELLSCDAEKLGQIKGLKLNRLLDNTPIELSATQLFEQLNLQLIHALDFLPPASWKRTSNEFFFGIFKALYAVLTSAGKLRAKVLWDESWPKRASEARPDTWRHWIIDMLPERAVLALASKQIAQYSANIGHSLEYKLEFLPA